MADGGRRVIVGLGSGGKKRRLAVSDPCFGTLPSFTPGKDVLVRCESLAAIGARAATVAIGTTFLDYFSSGTTEWALHRSFPLLGMI